MTVIYEMRKWAYIAQKNVEVRYHRYNISTIETYIFHSFEAGNC